MKNAASMPAEGGHVLAGPSTAGQDGRARDGRTRDAVARLLLERGPLTAAELGRVLGVSPAGVRRHLDAMLIDGLVGDRDRVVRGRRGRGRPAREFVLTDAGRISCGRHTYDDLAASALRWIYRQGGVEAVSQFVAEQVADLEERCRTAMEDAGDDPLDRAEGLARALSAEGYAASASALAAGGQLCQHHCPVAHVAAEFPQLCEAETQVISKLVGTHVQRLATIANGDGVCTTYIPGPRLPGGRSGNPMGSGHPRPAGAVGQPDSARTTRAARRTNVVTSGGRRADNQNRQSPDHGRPQSGAARRNHEQDESDPVRMR